MNSWIMHVTYAKENFLVEDIISKHLKNNQTVLLLTEIENSHFYGDIAKYFGMHKNVEILYYSQCCEKYF